jgi:hypothetical protein
MDGLKMKNKRGDIPITILVIGVFAVCTLAILSFIASTISLRNSFVGIDLTEKINKQIETKEFGGQNNFLLHEETNKTRGLDYMLRGFKDEILVSVEYNRP